MKSRLLFPALFLVGMVLACFSTKVEAIPSNAKDEHPIELWAGNPPFDPNAPRSPLPVSCYFNDVSENLYFTFLSSIGDVTITLSEANAGVVSCDDYPSSLGQVIVPVPMNGTYEINVLLPSGEVYSGTFVN